MGCRMCEEMCYRLKKMCHQIQSLIKQTQREESERPRLLVVTYVGSQRPSVPCFFSGLGQDRSMNHDPECLEVTEPDYVKELVKYALPQRPLKLLGSFPEYCFSKGKMMETKKKNEVSVNF